MKTTERDIRKYVREAEETPLLENIIEVFSRPSIEFTITPPKHEKRVLKKAEKPQIDHPKPTTYDVEFHVFNKAKDEDFQIDKNTLEENVPVGVSDKDISYQGVAKKVFPKVKDIPVSFYDPKSEDYMDVDKYFYRFDATYTGDYNVKAKLLKEGVELAESNQLSWDIFEEERRKRQEEQERQEKERKQAEIERIKKGIEEQSRITQREIEVEKGKQWLHDHAYNEYRRLFGDDKKRNQCICR